ncbi:MAG: hypothetical protein CMJ49_07715 [Planctomycetaceae bacterium]|nr:hypothetical protein [Planctomycetaceae bacterium]
MNNLLPSRKRVPSHSIPIRHGRLAISFFAATVVTVLLCAPARAQNDATTDQAADAATDPAYFEMKLVIPKIFDFSIKLRHPAGAAAPAGPPPMPLPPPPRADATDGPAYLVGRFIPRFAMEHPQHPAIENIDNLPITLGRTLDGYVAPGGEGVPLVVAPLAELTGIEPEYFYATAIRSINQQILAYLTDGESLLGVLVAPDPYDIDEIGQDIRPEDQSDFHIVIRSGLVEEIRSVAAGDRVPTADRINADTHARVLRESPIQKFQEGDDERRDLLRRDAIDDYVFRLNRHPGRQVDVSIAASEKPGHAIVDYRVTENKPWMAYFQLSNTGTASTAPWRERFGLFHNQLTGNDDVFVFEYITTGFDQTHTFLASYEAPFFDIERLRWRGYGAWSEFTASDVGFAGEEFTGEEWSAGGEFIWNTFQFHETFIDLIAGARWNNIQVQDKILGSVVLNEGQEEFFLPHAGAKLERVTQTETTNASVLVEWNEPSIAGTSEPGAGAASGGLNRLGRLQATNDFMVVRWNLSHSLYLEPLLNQEAWADTTTPSSSTLAHEMAFSVRGQAALRDRVIAQAEYTAGGLYTVRGYPESVVAGDNAVLATAEYRFHLPRILALNPDPTSTPLFGEPFRVSPQQVFDRPDWDLMFKAFFDWGRVTNKDRQPFEKDQLLMSTGVGVEALFKRNVSVRLDWGWTLKDLDKTSQTVNSGDSRLHIVATFLY